MVAIKKYSVAKKKENVKGKTLHDIVHEGLTAPNGSFSTLFTFATVSLRMHSCRVSELREVRIEMQVMPPLDDNFSRKFLFESVGCQLATLA